jgi:site-specific DNA recombinase
VRILCELYPDTMIMLMKEGINDNYDSLKGKNQADEIIISFKNLINDAYCRDISIKIRSNLEIKRNFVNGWHIRPMITDSTRK